MTMTGPQTRPGFVRRFASQVSVLEWVCAGAVVVVFAVLVALDPDVVEAPWQSERAIAVVVGGTILAAAAFLVMLRLRVPPVVRVLVLGVPLVVTGWWLISPFFTDTVVREDFAVSIADAQERSAGEGAAGGPSSTTAPADPAEPVTTQPPVPPEPRLLGSGSFVGLAGHKGTGDAGIFRRADGSFVLRLENLRIDNGPDLQLHLVPGADRRSPGSASHHFGALRGNIGDQTYEIPRDFAVTPGSWTVLVWCRAFAVEFVAATVEVGA